MEMTTRQRTLVTCCVTWQLHLIRTQRQRVKVGVLLKDFRRLLRDLQECCASEADAYQIAEDAVRYVKQHLADAATHSQAKALAILQNRYRATCVRLQGDWWRFLRKKADDFLTGYQSSVWRVLRAVLLLWALLSASLLLFREWTGQPALVYSDARGTAVPRIYYPYFSLVTLVSLGYGDMQPNTRARLGCIPAYLSSGAAALGVGLLGVLIAVVLYAAGAHPSVRPATWFENYEQVVLRRRPGAPPPPTYPAGASYDEPPVRT